MTTNHFAFPLNATSHTYLARAWENGWPFDDMKKLLAQLEALPKGRGQVGSGAQGAELEEKRACSIAWVPVDDEHAWIYERISLQLRALNEEFFGLDLSRLQSLQYTVYEGGAAGEHYDWHVDVMGAGAQEQRKLSYALQLSDPEDYEGGDLMFRGASKEVALKRQGIAYVFPSFTEHRVTPVTAGVRRSLVAWATGPQFR